MVKKQTKRARFGRKIKRKLRKKKRTPVKATKFDVYKHHKGRRLSKKGVKKSYKSEDWESHLEFVSKSKKRRR